MHKHRSFSVALIGISDNERHIVQNIFKLSSYRNLSYFLTNSAMDAEILIVCEEARGTVAQTIGSRDGYQKPTPIVTVAKGGSTSDGPSLRRPFVATRVLSVLDRVASTQLSLRPEPALSDDNSRPAKTPKTIPNPSPGESTHQQSHLALVVDDSLAVRKLMELELRVLSIHADFAENGSQALDLIKKNDYDIIFLDVILPDVDGYKICKTIKKDKIKKKTPVLMLTGKSSTFDRVRGKFSGCDSYLTKPAQSKTLRKAVKQYLPVEINPAVQQDIEGLPNQEELIRLAELS